jgi:hypothetical protein
MLLANICLFNFISYKMLNPAEVGNFFWAEKHVRLGWINFQDFFKKINDIILIKIINSYLSDDLLIDMMIQRFKLFLELILSKYNLCHSYISHFVSLPLMTCSYIFTFHRLSRQNWSMGAEQYWEICVVGVFHFTV